MTSFRWPNRNASLSAACCFFLLALLSCSAKPDIDQLTDAEIKTLPPGFYAYRYGSLYVEDPEAKAYRLWFETDRRGDPGRILSAENFQHPERPGAIYQDFGMDTPEAKHRLELFAALSRNYGFGHILVDTIGETYLSSVNGLLKEYVKPFSDSLKGAYSKDGNFTALKNGWFKNKRK